METLKSVLILSVFLVYYADARRSKEVYTIKIDERGIQFNETVEINDKERSVVYTVPAHNDVVRSEISFDYNTGYFATRIPKLKECYIQRMPKRRSSPGLVRKNLQQYRVFSKERKSTVPVKTIVSAVVKERRISRRELSPSFLAFCGNFVAYQARQIYHKELSETKRNETNGKEQKKKANIVYPVDYLSHGVLKSIAISIGNSMPGWKTVTVPTCEKLKLYLPQLKKDGCDEKPDDWEYECGAKTLTCIYNVKCKLDKAINKITCKETHFFTGFTCCKVKCP